MLNPALFHEVDLAFLREADAGVSRNARPDRWVGLMAEIGKGKGRGRVDPAPFAFLSCWSDLEMDPDLVELVPQVLEVAGRGRCLE